MTTEPTGTEPPQANAASAQDEFAPITTQEQFERALSDRLKRERAKFADYDDLKTRAARWDEVEAANKTELEKAQDRIRELESARNEDASERTRLNVIATLGIPPEYHDLITGQDEAEMTKRARQVRELLEAKAAAPDPNGRRLVVPSQGRTPEKALNGSGLEDAIKRAVGAA
ncbi:capsid assembly scaffolding protein Gp46 family protein [Gryllotalpicola protaetiae]|uniref:DUF4355 domain-containing protein n=1 Tax=Gryllotalpicola protaetiae TaxID=2419771 RepID=A0A387BJP6_9MICO|nr:DUF4355 domain-containing protein [Gryllotalpicola protaetiae]AYG02374.1 hypothetical protein D7I44_01715 [Gryllotalpicola protaetiae]